MEYYKDPAKRKEAIRGGYWHSGDLGMINEKGHLKFADRLKDYPSVVPFEGKSLAHVVA
jgi:long-subunit acyl-CoA synthetase (AMP-forming)